MKTVIVNTLDGKPKRHVNVAVNVVSMQFMIDTGTVSLHSVNAVHD